MLGWLGLSWAVGGGQAATVSRTSHLVDLHCWAGWLETTRAPGEEWGKEPECAPREEPPEGCAGEGFGSQRELQTGSKAHRPRSTQTRSRTDCFTPPGLSSFRSSVLALAESHRAGQRGPPLTIGGPGFDSQLYLKIITPLHSLSGPQFLYLPQNSVKPRGLRETTGAKTPQRRSHHCGHPGGPEASQGPSPGQPAGRAAQSSSKHKTSAGPRFP